MHDSLKQIFLEHHKHANWVCADKYRIDLLSCSSSESFCGANGSAIHNLHIKRRERSWVNRKALHMTSSVFYFNLLHLAAAEKTTQQQQFFPSSSAQMFIHLCCVPENCAINYLNEQRQARKKRKWEMRRKFEWLRSVSGTKTSLGVMNESSDLTSKRE